jgi:hypothetical protein
LSLKAVRLEVDRMTGAEAAVSTDSATDLDSRGVVWDGRLAQTVKSLIYSQFD